MAYTHKNFKTKKELREAFKAGEVITVYQPGPFPLKTYGGRKVVIEGPHYPEPHRFYAEVEINDRHEIVKVK